MNQIRIELAKLKIFAHHGVHEEERKAGAEFEVKMDIRFNTGNTIQALDQTVDYTAVYSIIREEMARPRPLLETVGTEIVNRVRLAYPYVEEINITISKINPPLANFRGELGVSVTNRKEL